MNRSLALGAPVLGGLLSRRTLPAVIRVGAAIAVAVIPFLAYAINILHSFYDIGNAFHDAGWSAYLIHDGDLLLHQPPCVDDGISWFHLHITPVFVVTSALGGLMPLTRIQFYAAYVGISHALPAIAVFWLLVSGYRMTRPAAVLAAAVLALCFAFDGLALAIARFPHFIMFLVGTGMMFLVALVLRRFAIALVFFVLCLARERTRAFTSSLCCRCRWPGNGGGAPAGASCGRWRHLPPPGSSIAPPSSSCSTRWRVTIRCL